MERVHPTAPDELEQRIEALSSPRAYPQPPGAIEVLQTHVSVLFLAETRVYKLKKAIRLEFLDHRSLDARRRACEEEVRLNRRLCPGVHLGVLPVTREADGSLVLAGRGETVDWVVEMVRLPAERMLDRLLERDAVGERELEAVASVLARFHASAETGPGIDELGSPDALARRVRDEGAQLRAESAERPGVLSARALEHLEARSLAFLERERALLERRVAAGRIRDGHGDLHAGNVCLRDGEVLIYDCIEFDPRLRRADVAADLAFLLMDLDHRGHASAAERVLRAYARLSGDGELDAPVAFHRVQRALVRVKVQMLTARDGHLDEGARAAARREARRYAQLALGYELPPALVLTCGPPASGKTTLARHVAGRHRWLHLRSDVLRERGEGYSPEAKRRVYGRMLELALAELERGGGVVADASFSRRAWRAPFLEAARRLGRPAYVLALEVPAEVAERRAAARAREGRDASEADAAVARAERAHLEPLGQDERARALELSGESEAEEGCDRLQERMLEELQAR